MRRAEYTKEAAYRDHSRMNETCHADRDHSHMNVTPLNESYHAQSHVRKMSGRV